MIEFVYTARDSKTGETLKGEVQADSEQSAARLLMERDAFPISIVNKKAGKSSITFFNKVRVKDKVIFTRQLATLINAGLPLAQSLKTVSDQIQNQVLRDAVKKVIADIEGGSNLSAAFGKYPKIFDETFISLIAAGESSGTLDDTLLRVATQQEKDAAILSKVRGALVYPVIVVVVIVGVLIFMLTTVLPQIGQLYHDLKKPLPFVTQVLVSTSSFLLHFWWLTLLMLVGAGLGLRSFFMSEPGVMVSDDLKLKAPIFGNIFQKVYMARFCRILGTMLASGIPMIEALNTVKKTVKNVHIQKILDESVNQVRAGKSLSSTLEDKENVPALVSQMVKIGEKSGSLAEMLQKTATFYEDEVDQDVKNLSTTIEPVLMIVLGFIVAFIIVSVLLPIYSLVGSGIH